MTHHRFGGGAVRQDAAGFGRQWLQASVGSIVRGAALRRWVTTSEVYAASRVSEGLRKAPGTVSAGLGVSQAVSRVAGANQLWLGRGWHHVGHRVASARRRSAQRGMR